MTFFSDFMARRSVIQFIPHDSMRKVARDTADRHLSKALLFKAPVSIAVDPSKLGITDHEKSRIIGLVFDEGKHVTVPIRVVSDGKKGICETYAE
jgi:hypothetical protein